MKVAKRRLNEKRKAIAHARALIGWTRAEWVNTAEEKLGQAALIFFKARLAEKNGPTRFARSWRLELDRVLAIGMIDLLVHPVRRRFDMGAALQEAVREMAGTIVALRECVQAEFKRGVGPIRRSLEQDDDAAFWKLARDAAKIFTG